MGGFAKCHEDLSVYRCAVDAAMDIFELTKSFPAAERFAMTDQIRRSSRSVCANVAEAWRKRRYRAAFVAKLSDAESEVGEVQVWLELAMRCGYIKEDVAKGLKERYTYIIAQLVRMMQTADKWVISST